MSKADWECYRQCPTCLVPSGTACKALSGTVVNGHPDGHEHTLAEPHRGRFLRTHRRRAAQELGNRIAIEDARRSAAAGA